MSLMSRITREIETKAMRTGKMGTEQLSVTLILTDDETKEFESLELDNHYTWEVENNTLSITYTEDIGLNDTILKLKENCEFNGADLNDLVCECFNCQVARVDETGDINIDNKWLNDEKKQQFIEWVEAR